MVLSYARVSYKARYILVYVFYTSFITFIVLTLKEWIIFRNYSDSRSRDYRYDNEFSISLDDDVYVPTTIDVVNPHQFHYWLNEEDFCEKRSPTTLIYVHSAPENWRKRLALRQTYADDEILSKYNMSLIFFIGLTENAVISSRIRLESLTYKDIIAESYIDSYRNLTLKAVSALKWIVTYCSVAEFAVKVDDDILINIFLLYTQILSKIKTMNRTVRSLHCFLWTRMPVQRNIENKWYVSKSEYPLSFYSPYCSGSAFILTLASAHALYNVSNGAKFFWVDDFFITGNLANKAGVQRIPINKYYFLNHLNVLHKFYHENLLPRVTFYHTRKMNHFYTIWKTIRNSLNVSAPSSFYNSSISSYKEFAEKHVHLTKNISTQNIL